MFSDRLALYLNQSVTWSKKTGQDAYNEPVYADTTVAARKERKIRMVRNATNENVVSNTTVFTQALITAEDQVDGENVIDVMDMVDKDGNIIGYEVLI